MDILNLQNWQIIDVTEEKRHFFIRAKYVIVDPVECPYCSAGSDYVRNYGSRFRSIKDSPVRGKAVSIALTVQKHKCLKCDKTFSDKVPDIEEGFRATKRFVSYIEEESLKKPFLTVSRETGAGENTVGEIFTRFIEKNANMGIDKTPTVLGIDEVYINRVPRCILTDIEERRIFDILPKRDMPTVYRYLIQIKNKKNIKLVVMDMHRPYFNTVKDAFPHAEIVIDTFHVQRMANQAINLFLKDLRGSLNVSQRRKYLRDRFILMKRSFNLSDKEKSILGVWKQTLPLLGEMYELKEEFLSIWRFSDRQKAEMSYKWWETKIPFDLRFSFNDILTAVSNWHHEIFNYFDYKVTNAFTESANNLIKSAQKQAPRCSFEVIRAKMLCRSSVIRSMEDNKAGQGNISKQAGGRIKRLQHIREAKDEILREIKWMEER